MSEKKLIPEPMYVALAGLMQAVVDRDYAAVAAFALPPRDHYTEASVLMDDSASPGFDVLLSDIVP